MKHSPGFLRLVRGAKTRVREVSVREVKDRLKEHEDVLLIDIREDHEWDLGHVAGAIHLSKGIIERDIEKNVAERNREIILYCGGGYRSALAADVLKTMGYTNVASLAGGWRAWKRARGNVVIPTRRRKGQR